MWAGFGAGCGSRHAGGNPRSIRSKKRRYSLFNHLLLRALSEQIGVRRSDWLLRLAPGYSRRGRSGKLLVLKCCARSLRMLRGVRAGAGARARYDAFRLRSAHRRFMPALILRRAAALRRRRPRRPTRLARRASMARSSRSRSFSNCLMIPRVSSVHLLL